MASIIRIKRSEVSGNPGTLAAGELAYSALPYNGSNGGDRLYIGMGTETAGNAANHVVIGGKFFTDRLAHTAGILTASSAIVVDENSKIDNLKVDNLDFNGNVISTTDPNSDLYLTPIGTGKTIISNPYIGNADTSLAEYIYDTVGGVVTAGTGITVTTSEDDNTAVVSITSTGVTAGSYGSATAIPVLTINAQGQITAASTAAVASTLSIAGDTGTDSVALLTDTLTFTGGTGITSTVTDNKVTFDIDSTVATLTGVQTLTNKTIDLTNNTLIATSAQLAAAITDETGTGALVFANSPTLVTPTLGVASATSINKVAITTPADGATLTIANNKTLTVSNTLTFTGTDNSSVAFGSGGTVAYTANKLSVFASTTSAELAGVISDETGTGSLVFANSPTLVTPTLGVASATSINKLAITAPATGATLTVADGKTLTASNTLTLTGTDGSSVAFGNGGTVTYTSNKLSVFSSTTSAELAGVISDETGTGALVFAKSPTLITPTLGAALATSITASSGDLTIAAAAGNNSVKLAPTGTGTVDAGSARITSVAEPVQATDAATKNYVDAVKTGLNVKEAARVATTAPLTATYYNGTSGVGATLTNASTQSALTIESIPLVVGDRVLVKTQESAFQNGIYVVTNIGSASTNWVLTRATDFDQSPNGEIEGGDFVFVQEGTVNADCGFVVTTNGLITVGTTPINWAQFSGAGQINAGDGLTKTGNTINAVGTANRISVTEDSIDIASTYVGQTSITTLGTIGTGVWQGTIIAPTYGGTGVNNGTKTITLGGNLTTSGAFNTTLTVTGNTNVTLPLTGTLATLAGTEALTNKTVNGLTITSTTGTLSIVNGGTLATAGAYSTTLTSTGTTNVTLPLTGTLATLAGTESLSNKTITASSFAGSVAATTLSASGLVSFTNATDAGPLGTAAVVIAGGLSVAKKLYVGTNIIGSGAATSLIDGFAIDGGTY